MPPPAPAPDADAVTRLIAGLRSKSAGRLRERLIAGEILRRWPHFAALVGHADKFHARAALYAAGQGQHVVFAAAGRPYRLVHGEPPHLAAMSAFPAARFAYCDADPNVTDLREAVIREMAEQGRVAAVACPADDPAAVIRAAGGGLLQVQFAVAAQWGSGEWAASLLGDYAARLPAGSSVALTVISAAHGKAGDDLLRLLGRAARCPAYRHGRKDIAGWLESAGLVLVDPPGVTDVRARDQEWADKELPPLAGGTILEAVAVVPPAG